MIQNVFRAEGIPLDLAYIPIIESGFKMNALSRASAKGPWQFMKATAVEQGLKHDWYIDERSDPEKATLAAAKYLKSLHKLFDGDWHLVLAAYNGGMGRVQRAMNRSGVSDFWRLSQSSRFLPRETREYVPLILAAIIVAKNPAQYGFEIAAAEPMAYDTVTIDRPIDLRRVAEWTGQPVDDIQALNPELRRWTTPIKADAYELKVPVGTADQFNARYASAGPGDLVTLNKYTVKKGDTISTVARKLRVSRVDLAEANHLSVRSKLRVGQALVIPRAPATLLATNSKPAAPTSVASRPIAATPAVADTGDDSEPRIVTHRVRRGDTLFGIARLYDTTVDKIKALNRLRSNTITPGDRLKVQATR
jgi:membrane-bound lytic murein transglycosylase D